MRKAVGLASLLFILGVRTAPAHAVSEKNFAHVDETEVEPFYEKQGRDCEFKGAAEVTIRCRIFANAFAPDAVVIVPGYSEPMRRYAELAYDLYRAGHAVFILDHRGQGESGRLLPDAKIATIDDFDYFVSDLHEFVANVVLKNSVGRIFAVAHSFGAAVTVRDLELYPNDFAAAVLSTPMLQMNLHGWNETVALAWLRLCALFGFDDSPVTEPGDPAAVAFEINDITHSRARYERNQRVFNDYPNLKIFVQTRRWVRQAILADRLIRADVARVQTPILLLKARDDAYVMPDAGDRFCAAARGCRLVEFTAAHHGIWHEIDAVRDAALAQALEFLRERR